MYPIMLRILGILTARVMMGSSAPHDKHWVTLTTDYVLSGIKYAHELKRWPAFLRPLVYRFMPSYPIVQKQLDGGRKIIAQAVKEAKEQDSEGLPPPKPPHVMWEFSREPQASTQKAIDRYLREQMNLAVGGIHTTSSVATQTIFQLVAHPEFIPILRREVVEAVGKCGGKLDKAALWSMSRLDSFIRETHRLASPNLSEFHIRNCSHSGREINKRAATLQRRVLVGTTLSDGTFLPKGSKLEFATHAIHRDEAYFENGEIFDGLRFFRMRQDDPGVKQHYVTAKNDYLGWGIGRSACPGRFLADVEIKLLIAYILLHYDLKAPENNAQRRHIEFENQVSRGSNSLRRRLFRFSKLYLGFS
jgi:cytochrome P450